MTEQGLVRRPHEETRDQPHLLDYVRVLVRRRYVAMAVFLVVVLGGVGYVWTATPIYEARARLLIEAGATNAANFRDVLEQSEMQQGYYQTQYQLLQSRSLAQATIAGLGLWNHPQLSPHQEAFWLADTARSGLAWLFSSKAPSPTVEAPAIDESRDKARVVSTFLAALEVTPVQDSRLVDVVFRSADPALTVRVVNGLAKTYISDRLDFGVNASRRASEGLNQQLTEQRKRVAEAEGALQSYREKNDALSVEDGQNIVVQKLADLNAALTRAKTERLQKEAIYRQLMSVAEKPSAFDEFPAILNNSFVQHQRAELAGLQQQHAKLADQLGELHPDMTKLQAAIQNVQTSLQGAVETAVQSVRRDYESAAAQEDNLIRALNLQKTEAQSTNRKAIEYAVLRREVESGRQIYDSLLQRARETVVSSELRTSNVRIVDLAVEPETPVSPRRAQILLIALLSGGFLALSVVFFFEYLDKRLRTPEEVRTHLRLVSLGMIPTLSRKARAANRLIDNGAPSSFVEAFRGLWTNVLFSSSGSPCSIVVTSAVPGEGKTIVASNLSVGLAQAGYRVVLLDADLRQPGVHALFGLNLEPGLSNLLEGHVQLTDVVRCTQIPNLKTIAAGTHSPNPPELLGSSVFTELLKLLEKDCDVVVIDTPPVMAVADAAILAHQTSGVLFVVAADTTSRQAAQAALEQLDCAGGRFLGAVLNRVDFERNKYYYGSYRRSHVGSQPRDDSDHPADARVH